MQHWILKTEPSSYSFADLIRDKKACWDGVRNYQARNNLRLMRSGDLVVIYESVGPKSAMGIARIVKEAYQDPKTKDDWSAVDIAPLKTFLKPVTLAELKADKILKNMSLIKQSRLSVCPITATEFKALAALGGIALVD